jgi:hypothetical protein
MVSFAKVFLYRRDGLLRVDIGLPPTNTNGGTSTYSWVHSQVLRENVEDPQSMQEPFVVRAMLRS